MAYLIPTDYVVNIQDTNIQQIISSDESIRNRAQLSGEAEALSYLRQKYDVTKEFQDLLPYAYNKTYFVFNRFYLDGSAYVATNTYNRGSIVLHSGLVYLTLKNGITGTFDATDWMLLGNRYQIFSVPPPVGEFTYSKYYAIGDQVFWKNNIYNCLVPTAIIGHDTALQYREINQLPYANVPPDDPLAGSQYWGQSTSYAAVCEVPGNSQYFQAIDNRDQQMVLYLCDIVLYHLHSRIAPRNIPELRVKRYDDAIAWLKMCAEGQVTPNLPLIQPKQGNRIRYGGQIRNINTY